MEKVTVPDIGDFKDVEIIEVLVKPGDSVAAEGGLVTLETDKATMDVPSPVAGTVTELLVKAGDRVNQGDAIAMVDAAGAAAAAPATGPAPAAPPAAAPAAAPATAGAERDAPAGTGEVTVKVPDIGDFKDVEIIDVLVTPGQDIEAEAGLITLETDKATMDVPSPVAGQVKEMLVKAGSKVNEGDPVAIVTGTGAAAPAAPAPAASPTPAPAAPAPQPAPVPAPAPASKGKHIHASPAVRKIGREFGVDLTQVKGSGNKGRILKEDVQAYVRATLAKGGGGGIGLDLGYELPPLGDLDHAAQGAVEEAKLSRIRQLSGPNLHRNWLTVPHVTQFDEADVTELEDFRKSKGPEAKARGFSLSPLAFMVKAITVALRKFPDFNAVLQPDGKGLIIKRHYHIGIAVNTPAGLMVPVLRDADTKSVMQLAEEMGALSKRTREGKVGPKDLRGGTFTVSSLGGIGGTHFTPIVNCPEVAILGVGRSRVAPHWDGERFVPRTMMPLSLSYDHRVIDGAQGAQFITHLSSLLGDIRNIVL